jgi:hypothetical protein
MEECLSGQVQDMPLLVLMELPKKMDVKFLNVYIFLPRYQLFV